MSILVLPLQIGKWQTSTRMFRTAWWKSSGFIRSSLALWRPEYTEHRRCQALFVPFSQWSSQSLYAQGYAQSRWPHLEAIYKHEKITVYGIMMRRHYLRRCFDQVLAAVWSDGAILHSRPDRRRIWFKQGSHRQDQAMGSRLIITSIAVSPTWAGCLCKIHGHWYHYPGPSWSSQCHAWCGGVVNPSIDCLFPFKHLRRWGLPLNSWLPEALLRKDDFWKNKRHPNLREYLDLVALGTIGDISPWLMKTDIYKDRTWIADENRRPDWLPWKKSAHWKSNHWFR